MDKRTAKQQAKMHIPMSFEEAIQRMVKAADAKIKARDKKK